ncbi:nucleoside triphosphate hydrolase [Sphingomonas sp.]|uniref:nucleoside triphosphate hydrolase n=1 Tax=Sphingomonas sp. TaxID=28214 RepID=UPI0035BBE269
MTEPFRAPLIAIIGSDGSGKSTVGEALLAWMQDRRPTVLHHLGKQTGGIGRAIARWPLVGRRLDSGIARRADIAGAVRRPGIVPVLIIYMFSMRRLRRFRHMLADRGRGLAVLADRFPQLGVPGPMDGLGLAPVADAGGLRGRLARCERAHYAWMATHRPDLVIRLNVDLATALARKPDHRPSTLARKIHDVPLLTFAGAPILDLDATRPLDQVIAQAKRAIEPLL